MLSAFFKGRVCECAVLVVVSSELEVDFIFGAEALQTVLMLCHIITLSCFSPSCDSNLRLISPSGSSERDSSKACWGTKPFREKGTVHKHTVSVFLHGKMLHNSIYWLFVCGMKLDIEKQTVKIVCGVWKCWIVVCCCKGPDAFAILVDVRMRMCLWIN
jgi:hypothetical protein